MVTQEKIEITAKDKTRAAFRSVNQGIKSVSSQIVSLKNLLVGVTGIGGFGLLVKSSINSGDALSKTADKVGIATEKLAGLHHATELFTSAGAPAMNEALTKAAKRLGEFNANGGGAAAVWLKELNLDTKELATLSPDKLFAKYAESIRGLNSRGEQLAAISALMGDESRQLIGIIDEGSDALNAATAEAEAYGLSLSRADAAKLEAVNDAVYKSQSVFKGLGNTIAIKLSPFIEEISNQFNDAAVKSNGFRDAVSSGFTSTLSAIGFVADALRGLNVVFSGLQAIAAGFAFGVISGFNGIAKGYIALRKTMDADYEPPAGLRTLNLAAINAKERFNNLSSELSDLVAQPMPSENIQAWANKVQAAAHKAGQKVAKTKAELTTIQPGVGEEQFNTEQSQKELEALNLSLLTKEQRIQESHLNRQFIIENAFQDELINEQRRSELLAQVELDKQNKLTAIHKTATEKRKRQEQIIQSAQLGIVSNALGALASTMDSNNRKQFETQKKLGIASALINTYKAISESLGAYPFPFNAIAAAASAALGYAQVKNIKSQQFGSSGSTPGVSSANNSIPTNTPGQPANNPLEPNNDIPQSQESESRTLVVEWPEDDVLMSSKQTRALIENMEKERRDMGATRMVFA